jgi:hypothetical protein
MKFSRFEITQCAVLALSAPPRLRAIIFSRRGAGTRRWEGQEHGEVRSELYCGVGIWSAAATTPLFLRLCQGLRTIRGKAASLPPHSK